LSQYTAALRAEEQDITVGRGDEQLLDEKSCVARFSLRSVLAAARTVAGTRPQAWRLDVAGVADGNGHSNRRSSLRALISSTFSDNLRCGAHPRILLHLAQCPPITVFSFFALAKNFIQLGDQRSGFPPALSRFRRRKAVFSLCNLQF